MTTDMAIIYAFVATVSGCLISVGAGLVAAANRRAVPAAPRLVAPKPEHARIPRQGFYGGCESKPLPSVKARDAQVATSLMYFKATLVAPRKKPATCINSPTAISGKNRISNHWLSACPCS